MKEGSIRERGNRVELRIRIDGKQCSFYGNNEAEARKKLREYRKVVKDRDDTKNILKNIFHDTLKIGLQCQNLER